MRKKVKTYEDLYAALLYGHTLILRFSVEADSEEEAKDIAREIFKCDYSSGRDSLELKAEEM